MKINCAMQGPMVLGLSSPIWISLGLAGHRLGQGLGHHPVTLRMSSLPQQVSAIDDELPVSLRIPGV